MDLLTHFCIASCKRDYVKQCRSISGAEELGAWAEPSLIAKKKLNHKIIIIFIFESFWRMAKKLILHL